MEFYIRYEILYLVDLWDYLNVRRLIMTKVFFSNLQITQPLIILFFYFILFYLFIIFGCVGSSFLREGFL